MPKAPVHRATLRDIANATGVSAVSVHKALTGKSGVSEETRRAVKAAAKKLHYSANDAASALKRGARSIAVVLPAEGGENDYFYRDMWRAVYDTAAELANFNVTLLPCPCDGTWRGQAEALHNIKQVGRAEGVVVANSMDQTALNEAIDRLAQDGVPVITVNSDALGAKRLCCVSAPNERAGRLAAEFMASGMPDAPCSVALCGAREMSAIHRDNLQGFVQELAALRPSARIVDLCGSYAGIHDVNGVNNGDFPHNSVALDDSKASDDSAPPKLSPGTANRADTSAASPAATSAVPPAEARRAARTEVCAEARTVVCNEARTEACNEACNEARTVVCNEARTEPCAKPHTAALTAALSAPSLYGAYSPSARGTMQLCAAAAALSLRGKCLVGSDAFPALQPYFESGILRATVWKDPYGQMSQAIHTMYAHLTHRDTPESPNVTVRIGLVLRNNLIDYL